MMRVFAMCNVVVLALAAAGQVRAQSDPAVGTWKLNVAKSKYNAGPAPKSEVRSYVMQGDSVKCAVHNVAADGSRVDWGYLARLNGEDSPITGKGPADTIGAKRTNATTVDAILKKGGKVVERANRVVSADGKTMTATAYKAEGDATPIFVSVYDRQ